jgi:glutamate-ammonia-ligase adenylyltransferase
LAAHGVLADVEARGLLEAYRFLRRLENRLQMEAERQVHSLATDGPAHARAARAMGYTEPGGPATFARDLERHRRRVRAAFQRLLSEEGEGRLLALFSRGAARLLRFPTTRGMVEELARHFARELEQSADPELALNNLDRFIHGIGTRTFYWGLLLDRPELVPRLASLFGASAYLSGLLANYPDLIEPVFGDPDVLLLSREELRSDLAQIAEELSAKSDRDPAELGLASLRLFQHRQLVNVGLLDLGEKIDRRQVESALTDVADVCLERAYQLADAQPARSRRGPEPPPDGRFCVVGLGKLGSYEMSYGSDLDVIFLYEPASAEGHVYYGRLARKLISTLDTSTAEGKCYSVDARLRPSGQQGALVSSLDGLREHHERGAMTWERQALLRARPVAGDPALGERFDALRREILARPLPEDLAEEIHRIRRRMETELAQEGEGRRDLKLGRGGLVDVEFAVQFLQLRHGTEHPALFDPDGTETQLERLESLALLDAERSQVLRQGWGFLQNLSRRLRVVQNRSISDLREDRADLDSVARSLGYEASTRSGDARRPLLADYQRHTDGIRAVYLQVLGAEDA